MTFPVLRHAALAITLTLAASSCWAATGPAIAGIPIEFFLFALTLLGVALLHNQTFYVALTGVLAVALYKIAFTGFKTGAGVAGSLLSASPSGRRSSSLSRCAVMTGKCWANRSRVPSSCSSLSPPLR